MGLRKTSPRNSRRAVQELASNTTSAFFVIKGNGDGGGGEGKDTTLGNCRRGVVFARDIGSPLHREEIESINRGGALKGE